MKSRTKMFRPMYAGLVMVVTLSTCSSLKAQVENPEDPIPIGCYVDTTQDCAQGNTWPCSNNQCIPMWPEPNGGGWTTTPIPGVNPVITCETHSIVYTNESVPYAAGTISVEGKEGIWVGSEVPCVYWQGCNCKGKPAGASCSTGSEWFFLEELVESEAIGDDCEDIEP